MKIHERYLIVVPGVGIRDGMTLNQAKAQHGWHKQKDGAKAYKVTSEMPFAPKGRKPRDNEASYRLVKGKLFIRNCEIVHVQE